MAVSDILAAKPTGGAGAKKYLGMEKGQQAFKEVMDRPAHLKNFMGPVKPTPQLVPVEPRYTEDHVFIPDRLSREDRARLQLMLSEAGLIKRGTKFRLGVWDETSQSAYRKLLEFANQTGRDEQEALSELASGQEINDEESKPLTYKETNPDEIRAAVQSVAPRVFGKRADPEVIEKIIQAFHQTERGYQEAAYGVDPNGTVTEPPSLNENYLTEELRKLQPETAQAYQTSGNIEQFIKMVDPQGMFSAYRS